MRQFETGDLTEMVQALSILPVPGAPCLKWSFMNRVLLKQGATAAYLFAPYMKAGGAEIIRPFSSVSARPASVRPTRWQFMLLNVPCVQRRHGREGDGSKRES